MKSFFKKLAFVMALAMVVTLAAPAAQSALAATEFTYAYQEGGAVTALYMQAGDLVDLRFMGVKDYADYTLEWKSENPEVATVNQKGEVKAVENGTTNVYLTVGDGSVYTSTPVKVVVGTKVNVALGTAKDALYTEYTLPLGETVDFNFYGVPNYSKDVYTCNWSSNNEDVATVDQKGVVTPVAAGVAEIKLVINNNVTGEVLNAAVTVTVLKNGAEFTARQKTGSTVELTFDNAEITKAELESGLNFYYYIGDVRIDYPVQVTAVKNGVATITSYVSFVDGTTYGFEYNGETAEFDATIGDVTDIALSYKCGKDEFKAYANEHTTIVAKLLNANGVDITSEALLAGGTVVYTLLEESQTGSFWLADNKIFFSEAAQVAKVSVQYITGKYDETTWEPIVGPSKSIAIVSSDAPAYGINVAAGNTATINDGKTEGKNVDWSKASTVIALGDDVKGIKKLIVRLTDTTGEKVYTDAPAGDGFFTLESTNNSVLYVSPDGTLMTNASGTVNVLVKYNTTVNGTTTSAVVAVVPLVIKPARAVSGMSLDKSTDIISTDATLDLNTTTFKVTLKDQLNSNINADGKSDEETVEKPEVKVTSTVASTVSAPIAPVVEKVAGKTGEYTITVTANAANIPTDATAYSYTCTVKTGNITKTFTVSIRKPNENSISGSQVVIGGDTDVKIEDSNSAQELTIDFYRLSNGVKFKKESIAPRTQKTTDMIAGNFYYVITKNGTALTSTTSGAHITLPLVTSKNAEFNSEVTYNEKSGVGSYTVIVYEAKGTVGASASALTQVASASVNVVDSRNNMQYVGKSNNFATVGTTANDIVMNNFKFTLGNTTYTEAKDYTDIYVDAHANMPVNPAAGSVCFIKTVDFYVLADKSNKVYEKYTVTVNDYVQFK